MEKIKVFLVDDHQLVRDGIKALLSGITDITITGEASSGNELLEKIEGSMPDVLLMDISLPDISGIELTRQFSTKYPKARVLILSMYTNEDFIFNALKAGARGYLPKNTSRQELLDAIYAVNSGQEYFGASISKIILKSYVRHASERSTPVQDLHDLLSAREIEILKLYAEGCNNKEISAKLDISIRTVESHKNHIVKKLGLKSTVDMVKFAIKNNIIKI
jgi:two-component system, NarL family, response regulator NreC